MAQYKLQAEANGNKGMYRIYKDNTLTDERVFRVYEDSSKLLKQRTLSVLTKGLLAVSKELKHNDNLKVELNNVHLVKWLNEETEYKGYDIQKVFKLLNQLPCEYSVEQVDLASFKRYIKKTELNKEKEIGFAELLLREMDEA